MWRLIRKYGDVHRHERPSIPQHHRPPRHNVDTVVKTTPAIGAMEKVLLPGETPWAKCVAIEPDGSWHGRIANKLFTEYTDSEREEVAGFGPQLTKLPRLHDFKQDQVVRFGLTIDHGYEVWKPLESAGGTA
jgi:hypothetical protein